MASLTVGGPWTVESRKADRWVSGFSDETEYANERHVPLTVPITKKRSGSGSHVGCDCGACFFWATI